MSNFASVLLASWARSLLIVEVYSCSVIVLQPCHHSAAAHRQQQHWEERSFMQSLFLDAHALLCALEDCAIKNYTCSVGKAEASRIVRLTQAENNKCSGSGESRSSKRQVRRPYMEPFGVLVWHSLLRQVSVDIVLCHWLESNLELLWYFRSALHSFFSFTGKESSETEVHYFRSKDVNTPTSAERLRRKVIPSLPSSCLL